MKDTNKNQKQQNHSKMPGDLIVETASECSQSMESNCLPYRRCSKRVRRVVSKSGENNISFSKLPQKSKRYFRDIFTTIIDARWRIVISTYLIATFGCWTIFATLWFLISYEHNDLTFDSETGAYLHEGRMTCVEGAKTFIGFFLLSFEMQSTVGFGERYPNEECPEAVFMMMAQVIVGIAIDGTMTAIIYAKLCRPPKKPSDLKFSRRAVICRRNSKLCLMFRICDPNLVHVVDSRVQACLIGEIYSDEGELINRLQEPLKLEDDGRVLVLFPFIVCHVIDRTSPLYAFSAKQFIEKRFEVIITFTGASVSTGLTTEERTSYLSNEISWGHRFVNMMEYDAENGEYFVDYDQFDVIEEVETPLCSAQDFDRIQNSI